jgi:D-alanine--D-alanine ligase
MHSYRNDQMTTKTTKGTTKNGAVSVAVLCGGPSLERGISLNSARSILDHLGSQGVEIVPIYFNEKRKAYKVSTAKLYSNTPSDFDFKLATTGKELSEEKLVKVLKESVIVFPCIHGAFGEDGEIQSFLEKHNIPYIGSTARACKMAFDKYRANEYIRSLGFFAPKSLLFKITDNKADIKKKVLKFWKDQNLERAIVKPASGGSSISVFSVENAKDAVENVHRLFSKRVDTRVVLEPFIEGSEFTVIVLENRFNMPVAIMPTEIEADYGSNQIFDFRKKYLPSRHVIYHCPPRFSDKTIEEIQIKAEQLFSVFGMRDFARIDGFLLPDGRIWFSDFNPISGMEQNSFLFQQTSRLGFSHGDTLRYIVNNACRRQNTRSCIKAPIALPKRKPVAVLFGGETAEKQVSLMSGTNVWLKLRASTEYEPYPYLLGPHREVWELPYSYILNHTVEEIIQNAKNAKLDLERIFFLIEKVKIKLCLLESDVTEKLFVPKRTTLDNILDKHKYVFLALHGGVGEDGTIQKILEDKNIRFNGSGSSTSRLCMDKWETNEKISEENIPGVAVAQHALFKINDVPAKIDDALQEAHWRMLLERLGTKTIIGKPRGDGCSAGVVRLFHRSDLATYISLIRSRTPVARAHTFTKQLNNIDMPEGKVQDIIFESFIETNKLKVSGGKIKHTPKTGYIEMTVGVLEEKGKIRALAPSITIAEDTILSVEEKFQGGTGVNITPPPTKIISDKKLRKVQILVEEVARKLDIRGYARIDVFANVRNGDIIVIEVNTLPALVPSTVLYHQALAENPKIYPLELLEKIISSSGY